MFLSENILGLSYDRRMNSPPDPACEFRTSLNWLLHRAAQKLGTVAQEAAGRHGITMRGHIVLTALAGERSERTQLALGHALGLDKTTLTAELDRLERAGLIVRQPDPNDRRVRVPVITGEGRAVQVEVEKLHHEVEREFIADLDPQEAKALRALLERLIASDHRPDSGSCL
jgi:DNA-binding MarR family transcriptional regulator